MESVEGGLHASSFFDENGRGGVRPPAGGQNGVANGDPVDCGEDWIKSERWKSAVRYARKSLESENTHIQRAGFE